jgi:hypothetical protein
MSSLSCAEAREVAPELALGVLGGAERAEALQHIDQCGPCRAVVAELTDAADALPLLAPEAEPPLGFERRMLARFGSARRRTVRRWITVVAATAAAAAIVSIVVVRVAERDDVPEVSEQAVSDVRSVPMIGGDGTPVGWAFVSDGRPAAMGVSVAYGLDAGRYTIEMQLASGRSLEVGGLNVVDGHGVWSGTADVTDASATATAVTLIDSAGTVVCRATLVD